MQQQHIKTTLTNSN